jgi:hypothetical protein
MAETFDVLNDLVTQNVIQTYAIAGAVAAYNYIEPTVTDDFDILVSFDTTRFGLVSLGPILTALRAMGYTQFRNEGIVVEGWTVQFLPVASPLDVESLQNAEAVNVTLGGRTIPTRVLRPEYLVAEVGRPKDAARIAQFVEEQAVNMNLLNSVLERFHLTDAWMKLCYRLGIKTGDAAP